MVTSYIDFLTFPLLGLGLLLTYMLNHTPALSCLEKIKKVVCYAAMWAIGYVGMWSAKWILSSVLLGEDMLNKALQQIRFRVSSTPDYGEFKISAFRALASNLSCFTNIGFLALIVMGLAGAGLYIYKHKVKIDLQIWVPYLVICIMPFVWCCMFKNHSYGHGSFTYRMFAVTVYAGMSMLVYNRQEQ